MLTSDRVLIFGDSVVTTGTENAVFEFAGFRLDPLRRSLSDPNRQVITLKPKVFDTLVYLVKHQGELLKKQALMTAIWGQSIVEENSLSQHISSLRRQLLDKLVAEL